jgi:CxxC motif-containing protein (DUF1111 family)
MAEVAPVGVTGLALFTAPSVSGLGFFEAVEDSLLLALADPDDRDQDGISGRVQLLTPSDLLAQVTQVDLLFEPGAPRRNLLIDGRYIGRFGKKASAINLLHQTVTAYREDMGITSDLIPDDPVNPAVGPFSGDGVPDPEVPSSAVGNVVFYLKTLRPPPRRNADAPEVVAGETLFEQIRCGACHTPTMRTGPSRIAALDRKVFHAWSDLLLHDMGPELDDHYTEGSALTSEWRTAPLWGIGLTEIVSGHTLFLHDGRARNLSEAILWHGGEGEGARDKFADLPKADRDALLAFVNSL